MLYILYIPVLDDDFEESCLFKELKFPYQQFFSVSCFMNT